MGCPESLRISPYMIPKIFLMKSNLLPTLVFVFAALASIAHAQLLPGQTRTFQVTGSGQTNTGATTRFAFTLSANSKVLTVNVDNNDTYASGPTGGRMTTFGFTVPDFTSFNFSGPAGWTLANPYDPNAGGGGNGNYTEDIGACFGGSVYNGTSGGLRYGESATFTFTFATAFTPTQTAATTTGFFTADFGHPGVTARWQTIGNKDYSDEGFGSELPIPEPATYGIVASAILLLGVVTKRRASKPINNAA